MKEILFRGKRKDNGEWVEGYPVADKRYGKIYIYTGDYTPSGHFQEPDYLTRYEVDPDTICQFTGVTDKNYTKIFGNDAVKTKYGRTCIVKWRNYGSYQGWDLEPVGTRDEIQTSAPDEYDLWAAYNLEVVGRHMK